MKYICNIPDIDYQILSYLNDVELFQKIYFLNKYIIILSKTRLIILKQKDT